MFINKKCLILLITCFTINIINFLQTASFAKKQSRYNYVFFTGETWDVSFNITTACVTPHQPYLNQVTSVERINKFGLLFQVGRHKSNKTVKCLIKKMPLYGQGIGKHFTFDKKPGALNFAFQGTLKINYEHFDGIILAQGHTVSGNNWWFGGATCSHDTKKPVDEVNCKSREGNTWCFVRGHTHTNPLQATGNDKIELITNPCQYSNTSVI